MESKSIESFDVKEKICTSVLEVFETMLSMELEYQEIIAQQYMFGSRLLGSINLVGKAMGIVTIQVSEELSYIMTGQMLGIDLDEIESSDEIRDVIGEVLNIIGGNLKSSLCDAGLTCKLSTPALTSGKDYKLETAAMTRNEYLTFYFQDYTILVYVGLKNQDLEIASQEQIPDAPPAGGFEMGDIQIAESISQAVAEVFDTMLDMDIAATENQPVKNPDQKWIVGSVSLSGVIMGRVNIHLSDIFSNEITAAMLDMASSEIEDFDTVKDCIGEVCNMISGHLKTFLCDAGLSCQLSPPSFTSGKNFETDLMQLPQIKKFEFQHQGHVLLVEVGLKPAGND